MPEWTSREQERFVTGHYKPVPWQANPKLTLGPKDPRALHFPHISKDDPALIAYTQNPAKGERDLKTKIKSGAYLKKFFSDILSSPEIAALANLTRIAAGGDDTQLIFATTPEECVEAYRACTASCVSYASGGYKGPVHPANVYGSPDPHFVTVAYLKRGERITAKALVNRPGQTYQSTHGDTATITKRLNDLGYTAKYGAGLVGLAIHAIPTGEQTPDKRPIYVGPCIDGHAYARHDATLGALVLCTAADFAKLPPNEKVNLGYNLGLTA